MSSGTLDLNRTDDGIESVITMPDTTFANDLAASVARGDIRSQSFGFSIVDDEWTLNKGGADLRMVKHIELVEVSVVPLPAYDATDLAVAQRGLEQHRKQLQSQLQKKMQRERIFALLGKNVL